MTVELIEAWVPMSIEDIIDAGLATPEILAEYDVMRVASRTRWEALPWSVRTWRMVLIWAGRHGLGRRTRSTRRPFGKVL